MADKLIARRVALLLVGIIVVSSGAAPRALAAGVVGVGSPGSCTQGALEKALGGGGLVTFNCGGAPVTIPLVVGTGETIGRDTTVDGGGLITIDSTLIDSSVFYVDPGSTLTVENLTLVNANALPDEIAVISNDGTVVATNCTFSDDSLAAIFTVPECGPVPPCIPSGGIVSATDCTFIGKGGGVIEIGFTVPASSAVAGCTFANAGTGISTLAALTVTNSTFTGNARGINGLDPSGTTITNCTFSGNHTAIAGTVTLINTIVADSSVANCNGTITDHGHNLDDGSSCGFTAMSSLSSTPAGLDPAGLQSNGGLTQTIALQSTSAAVDGGDDSVCSGAAVDGLDQRGFARPGAGHTHCSIGAYEFSTAPPPSHTPSRTPTETATQPTRTPTRRPTRTATHRPTSTPTLTPTRLPTRIPTRTPTRTATQPTRTPTRTPTVSPTRRPTLQSTRTPTNTPTRQQTMTPTRRPTHTPTLRPTRTPTDTPTRRPTMTPTRRPTRTPTPRPTRTPTNTPTRRPTMTPTRRPTRTPTPT